MALAVNVDDIKQKVEQELQKGPYACSTLVPLSGGTANFIFRGVLKHSLPDGTTEVVIKHGEEYVALNQGFRIPTSRCRFEEVILEAAVRLPPVANPTCLVRTPRLFAFDAVTNTQVQECLPGAVNLKNYALRHYVSTACDEPTLLLRPQCLEIGRGLGAWLRGLHSWARQPGQAGLREQIAANKEMQALKSLINYTWLLQRVDQFPDELAEAKGVFEKVRAMAAAELEDEARLQVIHGDFWTGNALLHDEPIQEGATPATIFIIDWEMCQLGVPALDLGQMVAELYELTLFKGMAAGAWMVEGFAAGYGYRGAGGAGDDAGLDDDLAFRTAIQVGTHLISFGSSVAGWGTPEQVREVVAAGRDTIVRAWRRDREWFRGHSLGCLFGP